MIKTIYIITEIHMGEGSSNEHFILYVNCIRTRVYIGLWFSDVFYFVFSSTKIHPHRQPRGRARIQIKK